MDSVVLDKDVVSRTSKDGTVVVMRLDDSDKFFKISGVAGQIWSALSKGESLEKIKANILSEYNVNSEVLDRDIQSFVNKIVSLGFAKVEEENSHDF